MIKNSKYYYIIMLFVLCACGTNQVLLDQELSGNDYQNQPTLKIPKKLYRPIYSEYYPVPGEPQNITVVNDINN